MKSFSTLIIISLFFNVSYLSAQSESNNFIKKFSKIDTDKNEVLTMTEVLMFYENKKKDKENEEEVQKLFRQLDVNKNDVISLVEFAKYNNLKIGKEKQIRSNKKDNKGTKKKVSSVTKKKASNDNVNLERVTKKFNNRDTNNDHVLSKAEFVQFYKGVISKDTGKPLNGEFYFYSYDFNLNDKVTLAEFRQKPDWNLGKMRLKNKKNEKVSLSKNLASNAYMKKRLKLFSVIDTDNNSKITLVELENYYEGKTTKEGLPINAKFRFFGHDSNDDELLVLSEFTARIDRERARKKYKIWNQQ